MSIELKDNPKLMAMFKKKTFSFTSFLTYLLLSILILVFLTLVIFVTMCLWNFVMPVLGVATLTFWQTGALMLLCNVLFGNHTTNKKIR